MASNVYMFLDRSFALDKSRIDTLIEYYKNTGNNYQVIILKVCYDFSCCCFRKAPTNAQKQLFVVNYLPRKTNLYIMIMFYIPGRLVLFIF